MVKFHCVQHSKIFSFGPFNNHFEETLDLCLSWAQDKPYYKKTFAACKIKLLARCWAPTSLINLRLWNWWWSSLQASLSLFEQLSCKDSIITLIVIVDRQTKLLLQPFLETNPGIHWLTSTQRTWLQTYHSGTLTSFSFASDCAEQLQTSQARGWDKWTFPCS